MVAGTLRSEKFGRNGEMVEIFEDVWRAELPKFEPIFSGDAGYREAWYPFVGLWGNGSETQELRALILESPLLRLTLCPDLGGRIVSIFDRRTQTELLASSDGNPILEGVRAAAVPHGLRFGADASVGRDLGAVQWALQRADEEEHSASIVLGSMWPGTRLRCWGTVTLPPDAAVVQLEVSVFNGGTDAAIVQPGFSVYGSDFDRHEFRTTGGALSLRGVDHPASVGDDGWASEFSPLFLGVGETRTSRQLIGIHTGLIGDRKHLVPEIGTAWDENGVRVQSASPFAGKVVIRTRQGDSLEAAVRTVPEAVWQAETPGIQIEAVAVLDESGHVVANSALDQDARRDWVISADESGNVPDWVCYLEDPGLRGRAWFELAGDAMRSGEYDLAAERYERALCFNAENPLAWWGQAAANRLANGVDESGVLPNAHFLSPVEPILRAEAFLRSEPETGTTGSPLLRTLAETPETLVEIAVTLYELRLFPDLARFIDDALRHLNLPMLRYIQASAILLETRMEAEALHHVQKARDAGYGPPYPFRATEQKILSQLRSRFPDDATIRKYLEFARWS